MFVSFTFTGLQAQWRDYKYKFTARVMDADTAVVIPNCHVINKTQNMGTVSDEFGAFAVTANAGDSLLFSAIGYERTTIAVSDSMYTNNRTVRLKPVTYALSEVDIGILSNYDRFKRDVLSKEAEEAYKMAPLISKYEIYVPPLPNQGGINVPLGISPITFLYNLWSKEGKQYRYYESVIKGTAEYIQIGEKFNGVLVKKLTGFENDELVKFMSYCMFTKTFLLQASESEIQREIMRKYREYIATKGGMK
ncbi:MAG: hypothetical protein LBL24_08910 [Bacteroidales bacterium]|nr:hypothetical protein [Bacteroidales bacterium]